MTPLRYATYLLQLVATARVSGMSPALRRELRRAVRRTLHELDTIGALRWVRPEARVELDLATTPCRGDAALLRVAERLGLTGQPVAIVAGAM